jgi:hypothetical protein
MLTNTLQGREISFQCYTYAQCCFLKSFLKSTLGKGMEVSLALLNISPLLGVAAHGFILILDTKFETPNKK